MRSCEVPIIWPKLLVCLWNLPNSSVCCVPALWTSHPLGPWESPERYVSWKLVNYIYGLILDVLTSCWNRKPFPSCWPFDPAPPLAVRLSRAVHWQKQQETVLQRVRQPLNLWKCAVKKELIFKSQKQICILQKTMLFWEGKVCLGFVYLFFDTLDQSWSMVYLKACVHPIRGHHQAFNACAHLQALKLASTRKKNLLPAEASGRIRNL